MDFILDVYVGWCLFFCFSLEIGCTGMKSEIHQDQMHQKQRKGEVENERQDFWCFTANRKILYASDRDSSGSRSAAGDWKFFYE